MDKVIGGEFDFLSQISGKKHNDLLDGCSLYASGRAALWQILNTLCIEGKLTKVFLPDYPCDSVYHVCDSFKAPYFFYPIQRNLRIDRHQLISLYQENGGGIIWVVNYFGIVDAEADVHWVKEELEDSIVVLDNVQAPFEMGKKSRADCIFTSLRKAFPVPDGGLVKTNNHKITEGTGINYFSQYKIAASYLKSLRDDGYYDDKIYLDLYERGESLIDDDYEKTASRYTSEAIGRLNVEMYATLRKQNAVHLMAGLKKIGLKPCTAVEDDKVPLFVPVVMDNRDRIRRALFRN